MLQWLHEQPEDTQLHQMSKLHSTFPNGPHLHKNLKLYLILRFCLVDFVSVLEMANGMFSREDVKLPVGECWLVAILFIFLLVLYPRPNEPLTLALNCYVLGDNSTHIFTVNIPSTNNISILKEVRKPIHLTLMIQMTCLTGRSRNVCMLSSNGWLVRHYDLFY